MHGFKEAWLIEYRGAVPCAVYVPDDYENTGGCYTCNAWQAKWFDTKEEAEAWMANPGTCVPFRAPWAAVGHSFVVPRGMNWGSVRAHIIKTIEEFFKRQEHP